MADRPTPAHAPVLHVHILPSTQAIADAMPEAQETCCMPDG